MRRSSPTTVWANPALPDWISRSSHRLKAAYAESMARTAAVRVAAYRPGLSAHRPAARYPGSAGWIR